MRLKFLYKLIILYLGEDNIKKLAILGSTGSIGQQTLEIVDKYLGKFDTFAIWTHKKRLRILRPLIINKNTLCGVKWKHIRRISMSIFTTNGCLHYTYQRRKNAL